MPLDLVPVQCGKVPVNMYPRMDPTRPAAHRAHAIQSNKSAIVAHTLPIRQALEMFGQQCDSVTTVEGLLFDWLGRFDDQWFSPACLTILSYHSSTGVLINDTTDPNDPSILLPIADGPLAVCRSADVSFVRVRCELDYADLVTMTNPGNTVLRVMYYIELPQTTHNMINGNGQPYILTTFGGVDNILTLDVGLIQDDILTMTMQDKPYALSSPDFNLPEVNRDSVSMMDVIEKPILSMAFKQICHQVFEEKCPGYTDQPEAALEYITQCYTDEQGNEVCLTTNEYFARFQNASRSFSMQKVFTVSICNKFMDNANPNFIPKFRALYADHGLQHPLDARSQRASLVVILKHLQQAEDECTTMANIARASVGQVFPAMVAKSQAEGTIGRYKDIEEVITFNKGLKCFGCNQPHRYKDANGNIICPNADKPGVKEHADASYAAWKNRLTKSRADRRKRGATRSWGRMGEDEQRKIRRHVLATSTSGELSHELNAARTDDADPPRDVPRGGGGRGGGRGGAAGRGGGGGGQLILLYDVQCLATQPSKQTLPVPIQHNFPHMNLTLGHDSNDANNPAIRCVIDTAAALSTGNFYYHAMIAKTFPQRLQAS